MSYDKFNTKAHLRKAAKLGDWELLSSFQMKPEEMVTFGHARKLGVFILFGKLFRFYRALLGQTVGIFFRNKWGNKTCGFLAMYLQISLLIIWNTASIHWFWKPFVWPLSPILVIAKRGDIWEIMTNVKSIPMLYFTIGLFLLLVFNIVLSWTESGKKDSTKRGHSYLYNLIPERIGISEYFVQGIIEPLIVAGVGTLIFYGFGDTGFGYYLWSAAFCLASLEAVDYASLRTAHHDAF